LHHESLDGRGYPHGFKGDEVPLLARIIAVADTFDALTTNRPYQQAHTPEEALKIIHSLSGKRLDPDAIQALAAIYARGDIRIQRTLTSGPDLAAAIIAAAGGTAPGPFFSEAESAASTQAVLP
jgi:HD-GYP domain-containing protein (c-di-GMP phosphodiesterase class II)